MLNIALLPIHTNTKLSGFKTVQPGLCRKLRNKLSELEFSRDLAYKLKKIVGTTNFSAQFIKIISYYKMIGYFATDCMLGGQPNP